MVRMVATSLLIATVLLCLMAFTPSMAAAPGEIDHRNIFLHDDADTPADNPYRPRFVQRIKLRAFAGHSSKAMPVHSGERGTLWHWLFLPTSFFFFLNFFFFFVFFRFFFFVFLVGISFLKPD